MFVDAPVRPTLFQGLTEATTSYPVFVLGRSAKHTHWSDDNPPNQLTVVQVLIDPADQNDWEATFTINLPASRFENRVVLQFLVHRVAPKG